MSLTVSEIAIIIQWLHLILGNFLAFMGVMGSFGILLVFLQPRLRKSICSRYMIAGAVFDFLQIIISALPRFLFYGFQIDLLGKHKIICKLFIYIGVSTSLGPHFCLYMSLFDQWTKSSRNARRRGLSTNRLAMIALVIIIIFCILFGVPVLYSFDIVNGARPTTCVVTVPDYTKYYTYFVNPVLSFGLPLIIITTFSTLTLINILKLGGQRTATRLEKQLTLMTIFQALAIIISSVPFCVQFFYSTITSSDVKDPFRLAQENLFRQIANILYYIVYVCPFYIYLYSSSDVRQLLRQIVCRRRNRVEILTNTAFYSTHLVTNR